MDVEQQQRIGSSGDSGDPGPTSGKSRDERIAELTAGTGIREEDAADLVDELEVEENETQERIEKARARGAVARDERGDEQDPLEYVRWRLARPPLRLKRVLQHGDDNDAQFAFVLDDGTILPIGSGADLLSPKKVRAAPLVRGITIPFFAEKGWKDEIVRHLPSFTVRIATGGGQAAETEEWLERWTHERAVEQRPGEPLGEVIAFAKGSSGPLRLDDGRLCVHVASFGAFVRRNLGHSGIKDSELRLRLIRGLGFQPAGSDGRLQARHEGKPVELRCLMSPRA